LGLRLFRSSHSCSLLSSEARTRASRRTARNVTSARLRWTEERALEANEAGSCDVAHRPRFGHHVRLADSGLSSRRRIQGAGNAIDCHRKQFEDEMRACRAARRASRLRRQGARRCPRRACEPPPSSSTTTATASTSSTRRACRLHGGSSVGDRGTFRCPAPPRSPQRARPRSCRTRDLPVDLTLASTRLNCCAIHKLHRPNPRRTLL